MSMQLKILLPSKVFAELDQVVRIVVETTAGSYGLLPNRLDCTAVLVPGILLYESMADGVQYVAVEEGILVKAGAQVLVSVRNAVGKASLGDLKALVEQRLQQVGDQEVNVRSVMARLESSFIRNVQQLNKD